MSKAHVVHINPEDNVVVAISPIKKGDTVSIDDINVTAEEDIRRATKSRSGISR